MSNLPNNLSALNIVAWNCDGIRNKLYELRAFIQEESYDIIALCETHLVAGDLFKVPGYVLYRNDRRGRRGGGTAILVRNNLKHHRVPSPSTEYLEFTIINVTLADGYSLNIGSLYSSCVHSRPLLESDLLALNTIPEPSVFIGDFNCKNKLWKTNTTNRRGVMLEKFTTKYNYSIWAPTRPTHYGTSGLPDILDMAIARGVNHAYHIEPVNALSSDHYPIELTIFKSMYRPPEGFKKTNWLEYQSRLLNNNFEIKIPNSKPEIESIITNQTERIATSIQNSTKLIERFKEYLPIDIKSLIRKRNSLRSFHRVCLCPRQKREIRSLNRQIKKELGKYQNERWEAFVLNLDPNTGSLWKIVKAFKREPRNANRPLHGPLGLVYDDDGKAGLLADSLELACQPVDTDMSDEYHAGIEEAVDDYVNSSPNHDPLPPFTLDEVKQSISLLKSRSAPGIDLISNVALKHLPEKEVVQLVSIFNASLQHGYFPEDWKKARVAFIKKPNKDPLFADHYRPISLLPTIGKLYERLILSRIQTFIDEEQIIPHVQFGFIKDHSTTLQLLRVTNFISQAIDERKRVVLALLDVKRAFDSVWHPALVHKLIQLKFPHQLVLVIHNFLQNRSFQASCNKTLSTPRPIEAGVPQGSVLSPTLFNIFTHDLPNSISANNNNTIVSCYADDVAIITRSIKPDLAIDYMQSALDEVTVWYQENRLELNHTKSEAIQIRRRGRPSTRLLNINDQPIKWSKTVKYLGVTFDQRHNFTEHIKSTMSKVTGLKSSLFPLLRRKSKLSINNKLLLYRTIFLPILMYACPAWSPSTSKTNKNKLQVFQNKFLRLVADMPRFVRNSQIAFDTGQRSVLETIDALNNKLYSCARVHQNPLIREIFESIPARQGRIRFAGEPP